MEKPSRLFDAVDLQLQKFSDIEMLSAKENGNWKTYHTKEVKDIVNRFSAGLLQLGIGTKEFTPESADKVAIISNNRPEWVFTDLAVQQTGAILVPLYPTTNPLEIEFILNDAAVQYIFVSSQDLYDKIAAIQSKIPSLKAIYSFAHIDGVKHWSEIAALSNDELLNRVEASKQSIPEEHVATLIYTSGTTGTPKGVMLTHKNIVSNALYSKASFPFKDAPGDKVLSFLPLNHIFEKCVTYIYLFSGITIYYAESIDTIGDNLKEIKPDGFTTVPRLLEKVFERIMATGAQLTGVKRRLFFWAVRTAKEYDNRTNKGAWYNFQLKLANKLIFSKWREALGGNITFIITGGAACSEMLLRIFNGGGIPVYEGYGPTENSPVIAVNRATKGDTKFGTVGPLIEGVELKLLEEDGEICVRGTSVMKGYYKRPDLTAETIIDGWLHTGDIGILDEGKFLKITDRKKELFKTSGGKYVAPQPIENKLKESQYVEQVMVVGAGKKFVGALIVPSFAALRTWAKQNGVTYTSNEQIIKEPKVLELFRETRDKYNQFFNQVEQIKRFELLPREWGIDTGEMTPKMSLKRKVIMEKYKELIEGIYN